MTGRLNWIAATALALGLLAGCGGGGGGTPPNITAAAGGTVKSDDGRVTLAVPPGAAPRDMTVRIVAAPLDTPPRFGMLAGYGYAIEGDGDVLGANAEVTLVLDAGAVPMAVQERKHALAATGIYIIPPDCGPDATLFHLGDVYGCSPIQPYLGTVSRDDVVALGTCAFEAISRSLRCLTADLRPKLWGVLFDSEPPTVSVAANLSTLATPGDVIATASAADNKGVAGVAIELVRSVGGVIDAASAQTSLFAGPPYQVTRSFTHVDNGIWTIRAAATDYNGNAAVTDGTLVVVVNIPAPPGVDTTAPTVALAASTTAASVGDTVTLSATASDDVGVTKVEFYKGVVKIGEVLAVPYSFSPAAYVAGDVGTPQVYTAKAVDAAGNTATSAPLTVVVSAPSTGDFHVNATAGSDANAGTSAAPFKTLSKAFSVVPANGTVWLQNSPLTLASEGTDVVTGRTVPVDVTVKAVNDGGATIGFPLKFAGSGAVSGVQFDISGNAGIVATSGTVNVSQPTWVKLGSINMSAAIQASGTAKVFLDPKGVPAHNYFANAGVNQLSLLSGSAELTVNGGVIDRINGGGAGYMNRVSNSSRLTLNNVSWIDSTGIVLAPTVVEVLAGAGTLALNDTTIDFTGGVDSNGGGNACIRVRALPGEVTTQTITLTNSMLKGCPGDAIQVRGGMPTITLSASTISGAGYYGIRAGKVFAQPEEAQPVLTLINSQVTGSRYAGIDLNGGGTVSITNSVISNNGLLANEGGLRLRDAKPFALVMRNTLVTDNVGSAISGGVVLQGDAVSTFDLGSKATPGGNTIRNNGGASTSLRAAVAAGVTVLAVGNTFNVSAQGSNASGLYTSSSSVCGGANPCDVSSGSGVNFAVSGGTLRLVDN